MIHAKLFKHKSEELIRRYHYAWKREWNESFQGSFSLKINHHFAVTVAQGADIEKKLTPVIVELKGGVLSPAKEEAHHDWQWHAMLYEHLPSLWGISHTHSIDSTIVSRHYANANEVRVKDWELLHEFDGISSYSHEMVIPVIQNSNDPVQLGKCLKAVVTPQTQGVYIQGHGCVVFEYDQSGHDEKLKSFERLSTLLRTML